MNKSIIVSIEELKHNLVNTINQAGVSPYFVEIALRDLYSEVKNAADHQVENEMKRYLKENELMSKEQDEIDKNEDINTGDPV